MTTLTQIEEKLGAKTQVILLRETLFESVVRDAFTFVALVSSVLLGWWIDSQALQWVGAVMVFISLIARSSGLKKQVTMTVAEARKKLDELEAAG